MLLIIAWGPVVRTRGKSIVCASGLQSSSERGPGNFENARGLRAKLARAEARIVKAAGTPASHKMVSSGDVQQAWFDAGTDERRTVIREQVERIVIGAPGRPDTEVFWRKED